MKRPIKENENNQNYNPSLWMTFYRDKKPRRRNVSIEMVERKKIRPILRRYDDDEDSCSDSDDKVKALTEKEGNHEKYVGLPVDNA